MAKIPDSENSSEKEQLRLLAQVERRIDDLLRFPNLPSSIRERLIESSFDWASTPSISKYIGSDK